jgi:glycosyltransferase involved in cell wall biosynthesis
MITIGVDARIFSTGRTSGIEEYARHILAHMVPLGDDVRWKIFYNGRLPLVREPWMQAPQVSVHDNGTSNRLLWLRTRLTGRPFLDELVGGTDVFFFPHFLLGALSPGCHRVMTWHDLSYERMPELLSWHRRRWHAVQMQPRRQAALADKIVAVSQSTADDLVQRYGISESRIAVVHSGIDPRLRRPSEPNVQQWRDARDLNGPFILALGTREPRKNLPALVMAWDMLRRQEGMQDVGLVIAGSPGWKERELIEAIASTRAPGMVKLLDRIEDDERPLLLSAASVLAYPSLLEGFGFPPLEAMACGTPVVASATTSVAEVIADAGLLADPYRIDGLSAALYAVLRDAGLRTRLVARGYERASKYSWDSAAQQTLQHIRSVVY